MLIFRGRAMTQESVSGQMGSSVLGYVVHPCREVNLFEKDDPELYLDLMTTRTGYLIKHTQSSSTDNPVIAFPQRQGEDRRVGLCYAMLLRRLQSTLFYMLQDGGCKKHSLR